MPYPRAAFIVGACLLLTTFASRASTEDLSEIEQVAGNRAAIAQTGTANSATLEQRVILGRFGANVATLTQEGSHNTADVIQKGSRNEVVLGQFGDNNAAQLGQYGFGLKTDVTQSGNGGGITVNQFGIGGGPVIVRQH
ncbi:MAG TPA: hypothetical protein VG900_16680 [Hyphomicrobiaceae bacterium]|jgi:minor curlin subunit|nr:hypothetical protein [Hyphomicrobiaceae bacterium]